MNDQHRRNLDVTARILNEADGLVEYVASDATLDSYHESILPTGWRFNLFKQNSPFVDSHDYYSIDKLLGRVISARVEGGQLIETVQWAKDIPEHKLATLGWKMTVGGFLRAVSVGFRVLKAVSPHDQGWNGYVQEAGLATEDAARCRRIYVEQEQIELSACIIGANPSAVAKAHKEGCISDGDLAGVGFKDADLEFLRVAGDAMDSPELDTIQRLLIAREIGRITSQNQKRSTPSQSPSMPDGGELAERQAVQRAGFVKQLENLLN